jgi:hypothetical protein
MKRSKPKAPTNHRDDRTAKPGHVGPEKSTEREPEPEPRDTERRVEHRAEVLRHRIFPAMLLNALSFDHLFDLADAKLFLDRLKADAGDPSDPVEQMLLEQLTLAHFRIGQLHASAGGAQTIEGAKILNGAACRMLAEFRKTVAVLKEYRRRENADTREQKPALKLVAGGG